MQESIICPICEEVVNTEMFIDEKSIQEFNISGMCKSCQDDIADICSRVGE